jgi:hypothetical protein
MRRKTIRALQTYARIRVCPFWTARNLSRHFPDDACIEGAGFVTHRAGEGRELNNVEPPYAALNLGDDRLIPAITHLLCYFLLRYAGIFTRGYKRGDKRFVWI